MSNVVSVDIPAIPDFGKMLLDSTKPTTSAFESMNEVSNRPTER